MLSRLELLKDKRGRINNDKSDYQPNDKTVEITKMMQKDFDHATRIMDKPYREFNDKTLIDRQSIDQKRFNAWQEPSSNDPAESWKSNAVRPIARNKLISIAAHITRSLIMPVITAQNENSEEDKDAATVMRDLMEWRNDQADYEKTFLYSVVSAMVNPAVIINTEYCKATRKIKEPKDDGSYEVKEVEDEVLSGFKDTLVPVDELYIENIYEHDIQKQNFLIWRKVISWETANHKYGKNDNFKYVKPGIQVLFNEENETFYDQYDEELQERLVEEVIYYNRHDDLQLEFVNGIIMSKPDQCLRRKDKLYPFSKTGYELIDEGKFFYYKSLMFKMAADEQVVETLYRMIIDGTYLQVMPPVNLFGEEVVDSSVVIPGSVNTFQYDNTRIEPMTIGSNLSVGMSMLEKVESSMSESSSDARTAGQQGSGTQTKYEIAVLEQNARTMLGMFSQMIGFMVKDMGKLQIGDVIQHLTLGDLLGIADGASAVKFRKFTMPDRETETGTKTRTIEFENPAELESEAEMMGMEGVEDYELEKSYQVLEQEGNKLDNKTEIYKVNPEKFRDLRFKIKITPDVVTPPTEAMRKAMNLEAYDRAIQNPLANQELIFKDLLLNSYDKLRDDPDKYIMKQEQANPMAQALGAEGGGQGSPTGAVQQMMEQGQV